MKLLLICLDGVGPALFESWLERDAPFWAKLSPQAAVAPMLGAWSPVLGPWPALDQAGVPCGLINLPGLWPPLALAQGFMVCRPPSGQEGQAFTHPPELARDLADYPQPPDPPAGSDKLRLDLRDPIYAERAALARLRFEHGLRLFSERRPELAALGWRAPALVGRLMPDKPKRLLLMLRQLDHYCAALAQALRPEGLMLCCLDREHDSGALLAWGPRSFLAGRHPALGAATVDRIIMALFGQAPPPVPWLLIPDPEPEP